MMKKILFTIVVCIMMLININNVYASNASIIMTIENDDVEVNDKVEIRISIDAEVTIKEITGSLTYDKSELEYVTSSQVIKKTASNLKLEDKGDKGGKLRTYLVEFKALKKGISKVYFSATPVIKDENGEKVTASHMPAYVEIGGKDSEENSLESLRISPGKLNKKFSEDVKSYSMTVEHNVTEVVIEAKAKDELATIKVTDDRDLKVGSTSVKVTVTAESGDKKEYIIKVKRLSKDEQKEKDEKEAAEARKKRAVIYEDGDKVYVDNNSKFEVLKIDATDNMKMPVDYKEIVLELYGVDIEACVPEKDEDSDMILIYAKNTENGYEGFYEYDKVEKTFQRYLGDTSTVASEKTNKLFEQQEYEENIRRLSVIVAFVIVCLIITLIIIIKLYSDIKNIKNENYLI